MRLIEQTGTVRYRTAVINPDGTIARERPWKTNMVTDWGLDDAANGNGWSRNFVYCAIGTGAKLVKRDSGLTTFNLLGGSTTITASANFFEAADVGRLIKFDTGEEFYVDTFVSPTEAMVRVAPDVTLSGEGTIWYINDAKLGTEARVSNTYGTDGGDNGTSVEGDTVVFQRTFLFPPEDAPVTYNELGWRREAAAASNCLGRDLIPGGGDTVATGQQYRVIVQMRVKLSPTTRTAVGNIGSGWDTTGTAAIERLESTQNNNNKRYLFQVSANGSITPAEGLNTTTVVLDMRGNTSGTAKQTIKVQLFSADWTQGDLSAGAIAAPPCEWVNAAAMPYTTGSFEMRYRAEFGPLIGNGDVYGIGISAHESTRMFTLKFDSPQEKLATHKLTIEFGIKCSRTLTN